MPYTASRSYTPSLCSDASHSGPRHNRTPVLDESEPKYLPPRFPHDTRYSDDSSSQPMLNSSFQCADEYNDLDARIEYADGSHRLDARMRYDDDYYVKDFDEASTPSQHDPSYRNDVHVRRENGQWDTRNGHDLYHQPDRESGSFDANELSYPARYDCTTSHPTNDGYSGLEDFRTGTPVTIGSQNLLSMSPPSRSRPQPRWRAEGARTELRDYSRRDRSTAPPDHVAAQTEPYARYTGEDHPSPRYDDSPRSTTHDLCHSSIPKPPRKQRPASHSPSPGIAPDPLEMLSLRNIVMIPEAKINPYKKREIGPGENAKAIFDFFIEDKGRVPTPELPIVQRRRSPLFVPAENEVTEPKVDWRKDKSIRNPKWFTGATSPVSEDAATARGCLPVVVGGPVIQKRHLYRSLEAFGLEMVECEGHVQSTDLVLSPKTAIIFHNLATLADGRDLLLHRVKRAAVYFERTIIILEVISYRLLASKTDADIETNPLTPELVKSLGALKRALAVSIQPGQDEMIGTAELIFAVNGSDEVAGAIRHLAEQDNLRISARCNTLVREVWDRKQWIQQESVSTRIRSVTTWQTDGLRCSKMKSVSSEPASTSFRHVSSCLWWTLTLSSPSTLVLMSARTWWRRS